MNIVPDVLEPAQAGQPHESDSGVLCTAELAECTCPEFCERDHDNE